MNHTKNYGLPQWELNDLIRMEDFNSAMSNIENGLNSNKSAAEAGDAELQRQVTAANTKAENAQSVANAAAKKPYVVGSYVGTGREMTITLGFRPAFLIISGVTPSYNTSTAEGYERFIAFTGGQTIQQRVALTNTGFTVKPRSGPYYPFLADENRTYEYIAFK